MNIGRASSTTTASIVIPEAKRTPNHKESSFVWNVLEPLDATSANARRAALRLRVKTNSFLFGEYPFTYLFSDIGRKTCWSPERQARCCVRIPLANQLRMLAP